MKHMKQIMTISLAIVLGLLAYAQASPPITVGPGGAYGFSTIQAAIDWAIAGETVQVYPGNYPENLLLTKDLTLAGVVSPSGERPHINPSSGQVLVINSGRSVDFSGFEVSNAQGGIYTTGTVSATTIYNNIFHDLDAGSGFYWGDDTAGGEAIYLGGNLNIYNNLFYNNTGLSGHAHSSTIRLRSDFGSHQFFNNTLVGNTNARATVYTNGPNMYIYNNIISDEQQGYGIAQWDPYGGWNPDIQYNVIYDCASGLADGTVTLSRTINEDPQFINALLDDYRLLPSSPAIDAGMDTGAYGVLDDLLGTLRPFDFPGVDNNGVLPDFDIGAYEAVPEPATLGLMLIGGLAILRRRLVRRSPKGEDGSR